MANELEDQADLAVRLRVALSLCPADALTHRKSERLSRVEKIRRHLLEEALAPPEFVGGLAEAIDRTLDAWQVRRENVAVFKSQLLERDGNRCRSCYVDLTDIGGQAASARIRDSFKLAWIDPARQFEPTVDHREPISKFGTNELDNLWLLCRFCNEGKGDGSPLLLKHELEYAVALPWEGADTPPATLVAHSSRLTYRVLARQGFVCGTCGDQEYELTIRKERVRGLAVLSNMVGICVKCLALA